jgi:preprotein translocase subunit SecE
MADIGTTAVPGGLPRKAVSERGFWTWYKPEQGKWTRGGSFVALLALIAGGGFFLYDRLSVFSGDKWWQILLTIVVPLLFMTVMAALAWWVTFNKRPSSDFMIATEGEMKKVSWSTRREVIGSTKVVIVITLLMAFLLFLVDLTFQALFRWAGVLKI